MKKDHKNPSFNNPPKCHSAIDPKAPLQMVNISVSYVNLEFELKKAKLDKLDTRVQQKNTHCVKKTIKLTCRFKFTFIQVTRSGKVANTLDQSRFRICLGQDT